MRWLSDEMLERLRAGGESLDLLAARYEIQEPIGRGGMGTVYLATDLKLERRVALKVLDATDASGELGARLHQEAKVLARLEHPGIVPIHDVGELPDGRLFYAMKYVDGTRLDRYVQESRSIPDRLRTFSRICEAVAFAHSRGILHRDLKPQNIMVGAFGEVLVMDWGVAKVLRAALESGETAVLPKRVAEGAGGKAGAAELEPTEHGMVLGTPGYMAPEQARGEVGSLDARADVYSLGAVLRYMLTGQPGTAEAETATADPRGEGPAGGPRQRLPRRLRAIVERAMASEAGDRYRSAAELARDVQRYLDGRAVEALPESIWSKAGRFVSRHRIAFFLILAYVVVRLAVVFLLGR